MIPVIWILLSIAMVFNLIAAVLFVSSLINSRIKKWGYLTALFAWLVTLSVFIINWISAQSPPFGNMYHIFVVTSLSAVPAWLLLRFYYQVRQGEFFFIIIAFLPLIPAFFKLGESVNWRPPPALQSVFFIPHVFAYMVSYLLLGVAGINGLISFVVSFCLNKERMDSELIIEEKNVYHIVKVAFLFLSTGMILGAFWAEIAWGRYWGWDIKETWALINWVFYLIYFHLRFTPISLRYKNLFLFIAFLTILITLLGVHYLDGEISPSLHTYSNG